MFSEASVVGQLRSLHCVAADEQSLGRDQPRLFRWRRCLGRTLPISGVSDSNDSIIQSSTDYNLRKRFPSMEVRCSSVDFVSV